MGSPTPTHQMASNEIQFTLNESCRSEYIIFSAPIDVILSDTEVRQPDLVMVHRSRMSVLTKKAIKGPPDLVVEIISAWSCRRDKVEKLKTYARYSVPEYWIIDYSNWTLEQYILTGKTMSLLKFMQRMCRFNLNAFLAYSLP
ncbi:MAG TPA: Uma2 family endonuclease [Bacilli bacterium]